MNLRMSEKRTNGNKIDVGFLVMRRRRRCRRWYYKLSLDLKTNYFSWAKSHFFLIFWTGSKSPELPRETVRVNNVTFYLRKYFCTYARSTRSFNEILKKPLWSVLMVENEKYAYLRGWWQPNNSKGCQQNGSFLSFLVEAKYLPECALENANDAYDKNTIAKTIFHFV